MATTVQVMRRIRKLVPSDFKKIKVQTSWGHPECEVWPGYTNGTLFVNVRGVCEWRAESDEKENCKATQIVISSTHHGIQKRYYRPRKDGTFNFDGIGTRLNLMVTQDAAKAQELAEYKAQQKANKEAGNRFRRELEKLFRQRKYDAKILESWDGGEHGESRVRVTIISGQINLSVTNLSVNQIDQIMEEVG